MPRRQQCRSRSNGCYYLLDRKSDQRDKAVAWSVSKMQDDEIIEAARDFDNEVILSDHPDAGYNLPSSARNFPQPA